MLQAIPHADRVIADLARVTIGGGRLHLLVEDYGMIHMAPTRLDVNAFWHEVPRAFEQATGTDLHIGRNAFAIMTDLGFSDLTLDYVSHPRFAETFRTSRRRRYTDSIALRFASKVLEWHRLHEPAATPSASPLFAKTPHSHA